MEPISVSDIAIKTRLASAIHQLSDGIVENHQLSYRESLSCVISKPKIQLLELTENIKAAESSYDAIKMQWDRMKSLHVSQESQLTVNDDDGKSASSLGSSLEVEESKQSIEEGEDRNRVQVVLTPRSQNNNNNNNNNSNEGDVLTPRSQNDNNVEVLVPSLDINGAGVSLDSIKTNKRTKKVPRLKRKQQVSDDMLRTSLIYTAPTRKKKMHGRLKHSNSKSTIATRETSFSDRRRFRRQKSCDTFQAPQFKKRANAPKARVEPKAPKALMSTVSSRQPKLRPVANHLHFREETIELVGDTVDIESTVTKQRIEADFIKNPFRRSNAEEKLEDSKDNSQARVKEATKELYEPFCQRNYEMPTMASKMKRVHRPYYHRFDIRNIPFVVGTSISPSHNLGLNIQQVLGMIKIRQPTVPGISSLLIRNVSRGTRPVSMLFEQINSEFTRSCRNLSCHDANLDHKSRFESNHDMGSFSCQHIRSNNLAARAPFNKQNLACEPLYEEDEESQSIPGTRQEDKPTPSRKQSHRLILTEDASAGDSMAGRAKFNYACNNKEMMEVFTRLSEQFEKMITQHDKLKEQLDKRKDNKSLAKEVDEMEEAMRDKEKEITALVHLYNEEILMAIVEIQVMSLKQQMRQLHERNSLVCIASEDPGFRHVTRSRSRTAPSLGSKSHIGHTPNALRLAGLLRQIQAFQRQLTLA
ncbi:hypothetical protein TSAR_009311 [Trichomalopsis sarcophagae]|uniref:Uncharacterized protein n=1 Tax=Trichomalopsis sarcophagae TaxID=543379 RepID=A0A232F6L6_9HYME|nr:hypothetical protein TSAR_009311 [Trichomalopsis sarcophagae]